MNKQTKQTIAAIMVIAVIAYLAIRLYPSIRTDTIITEQFNYVLNNEIPSGPLPEVDGWGNRLQYNVTVTPTKITHTIMSSGRDGKMGTKDDMVSYMEDLNKSRILGAYARNKVEEFVKGWTHPKENRFSKQK